MEDKELEYGQEIESQVLKTKDTRYKSRKFIAFVTIILISSILCLTGDLSGGEWVAAATFATTVYTGGNVVQKKFEGGS
jgi:hypothetical protein